MPADFRLLSLQQALAKLQPYLLKIASDLHGFGLESSGGWRRGRWYYRHARIPCLPINNEVPHTPNGAVVLVFATPTPSPTPSEYGDTPHGTPQNALAALPQPLTPFVVNDTIDMQTPPATQLPRHSPLDELDVNAIEGERLLRTGTLPMMGPLSLAETREMQ
ncbi:hypothetical protein C8T65DRAFT_730002, partial [Cerioporus squamosus]